MACVFMITMMKLGASIMMNMHGRKVDQRNVRSIRPIQQDYEGKGR